MEKEQVVTVTEEIPQEQNHKIEWIEKLRAIACMAVVMLHVTETIMVNNFRVANLSKERYFFYQVIFPTLTQFAVPVFIMISGCLLLNPKHEVGLDKIKKYLLKMLAILASFGFAFCLLEVIFTMGMADIFKLISQSFLNLIQGKSWGHMWYIYMVIGLYIITPILRKFVEHTDRQTAKFTLTILGIVTFIIPTMNEIFGIIITTFYLGSFRYIFLYLMGYYLAYTDIFPSKKVYANGILGMVGYGLLAFENKNVGINLFVVLEAMALFQLFEKKNGKLKNNRFLQQISKYSLGIYLVHPFWMNLFYKVIKIYPTNLPIGIGEMVFFVGILGLSTFTSMILHRILGTLRKSCKFICYFKKEMIE